MNEFENSESYLFVERANEVLDEILSKPHGSELFHMATIIYKLKEAELDILSEKELLFLANRIDEVSTLSVTPLLTAERVDAVCALLEYGITPNRCPELPEATHEQAKNILLNCDIKILCEILDMVAVDNQRYYAPDNNYSIEALAWSEKVKDVIRSYTGDNFNENTEPSFDLEGKHISEVCKGDVLFFDGYFFTAATDAYTFNTDNGKEWNVEVDGDGPYEYLYASYFENGIVNVVKETDKLSLEAMIADAGNRSGNKEIKVGDKILESER